MDAEGECVAAPLLAGAAVWVARDWAVALLAQRAAAAAAAPVRCAALRRTCPSWGFGAGHSASWAGRRRRSPPAEGRRCGGAVQRERCLAQVTHSCAAAVRGPQRVPAAGRVHWVRPVAMRPRGARSPARRRRGRPRPGARRTPAAAGQQWSAWRLSGLSRVRKRDCSRVGQARLVSQRLSWLVSGVESGQAAF